MFVNFVTATLLLALAQTGAPEIASTLWELRTHEDPGIYRTAARQLAQLAPPQFLDSLLQLSLHCLLCLQCIISFAQGNKM